VRNHLKILIPACFVASTAVAATPPDGIYDLVVGGEKSGVAVVDSGKFTRPVTAGSCTLIDAVGRVDDETLTVDIPGGCLPRIALDMRSASGPLKFQDSSSWYLNTAITSTEAESPTLSLASGLFLGQHYLYSDAVLDTLNDRYSRGDSRIERDIPSAHSRLTLGDFNSETGSSLIAAKRLGGIRFDRNWAQDPDRAATVYFRSSHTLKLTSRSIVEFYRDGQLVDRRELPAGDYDIRNLPAAAYSSRLKIKVTDSYGAVQEIEADIINPPQILTKGTFDYSFGLGLERTGFEGAGDYRHEMFSGFMGYGVTDWFSLFAAATHDTASVTASLATPVGAVSGEARVDDPGDWRVAYSYSWRNLSLAAEHSVQRDLADKYLRRTNVQGSVGLDEVGRDLFGLERTGSLTARFIKGEDTQLYGLTYSVSLPWSLSLHASSDFNRTGEIGYSAGLSKQWTNRFGTQVTYEKSAIDQSNAVYAQLTVSLDRSTPASVGLQANTVTRHGETNVQARAEGRYGLYGAVSTYVPDHGSAVTTATVAGSIACADGACRVGEPVSGGFAIGDGLQATGMSGSVLPLPAYSNTELTANTRTSSESLTVAVRPGQGVKLTATDKVDVRAMVYVDGKPANMTEVTWAGGETMTGEDGLLWIDRLPRKPLALKIGQRHIILPLDREPVDGLMDLGRIDVGSTQPANTVTAHLSPTNP